MCFLTLCVVILSVVQIGAYVVIRDPGLSIVYHEMTRTTCDVEEYRFQSFVCPKLSDCVIECALREHCEVLTYRTDDKLCELHQNNESMPSVPSVPGKCFSVQRKDIHINQSLCPEAPCRNGTACDRNTKMCHIKECLDVPAITNGRVRGNLRAVGNRIKYECDVGFILVNTSNDVATCLENGQWSTRGDCEIAPAVGQVCNDNNCNHASVHCVAAYDDTEPHCHCAFGFEFNEALGICEQVCKEFLKNAAEFVQKENLATLGYNLDIVSTNTFTECVDYCNKNWPQYLSIDYGGNFGDGCFCGSVSERQYIKQYGTLSTPTYITSFYNRPCSIKG